MTGCPNRKSNSMKSSLTITAKNSSKRTQRMVSMPATLYKVNTYYWYHNANQSSCL